jgi:hypothetical protein
MKLVTLKLAAEMEQYHEDIQLFLELMVHKLHKNVHKGRWEGLHPGDAFNHLMDEVMELHDAMDGKNAAEVFFECADVANYAMIIASITRDRVQTKTTTAGSSSPALPEK